MHTYLGPETGEQDHVRVRRGASDSEMLFFLFFPGKKPPSLMISNQSDLVMTVGGDTGLDHELRLPWRPADPGWPFYPKNAKGCLLHSQGCFSSDPKTLSVLTLKPFVEDPSLVLMLLFRKAVSFLVPLLSDCLWNQCFFSINHVVWFRICFPFSF